MKSNEAGQKNIEEQQNIEHIFEKIVRATKKTHLDLFKKKFIRKTKKQGENTCFFGNAWPKYNARAQQRKNIIMIMA